MRILVVEDEAMNRSLLRAVLGRATQPGVVGATLLEADTVAGARSALARSDVDVVLLDVRLPDGSGLELARELVDHGGPRPKIVILSASVLPSERSAALESGCDAFLGKPYRPADLLELLGTFVDPDEGDRSGI
jgi:CheY-like chemotaxis protein